MTRIQFIAFLQGFRTDLTQNKADWENKTLEDFLEAMISYTEDIQGFYDNQNRNTNADEATWENFKNILKGAAIYE